MTSQKVTIIAIGGTFADAIWEKAKSFSAQRLTDDPNEWSSEQWPAETRAAIDTFADCLLTNAFIPPILYRSQHVDLWSAGDIFQSAIVANPSDAHCQLLSDRYEVYAVRVGVVQKIVRNVNDCDEYRWLEQRVGEAVSAWESLTEQRVIVLVREVLGGLWEDQEVSDSLEQIPHWWSEL